MQSQISPSLTRFDVLMAFLRIHLWVALMSLFLSVISGTSYLWGGVNLGLFGFPQLGLTLVPVFVLWAFPSLLANNALAQTARDPLSSLTELRPLVGRCAGLFLFVQSLGQVVFFSLLLLYNLATSSGGSTSSSLFGSAFSGRYMWLGVGQFVGPLVSFLIGFIFAFGPAIRDNFRSR